jgi:hypothetical protein
VHYKRKNSKWPASVESLSCNKLGAGGIFGSHSIRFKKVASIRSFRESLVGGLSLGLGSRKSQVWPVEEQRMQVGFVWSHFFRRILMVSVKQLHLRRPPLFIPHLRVLHPAFKFNLRFLVFLGCAELSATGRNVFAHGCVILPLLSRTKRNVSDWCSFRPTS